MLRSIASAICAVLLIHAVLASPAEAGDLYKALTCLKDPFDAVFHRQPPATGYDGNIELLAREIDWLEHHIDCWGTVVAKQPDVWGQSRLTAHRYDFETQMASKLDQFQVTMNASLQRSDQAYLAMAFALQSAATSSNTGSGSGSGTTSVPDAGSSVNVLNGLIGGTTIPASQTTPGTIPATPNQPIFATAPFSQPQPAGVSFANPTITLEPTVQLDEMARYLNYLNELRRINEGDDTADSPGYSLNLVRIPVSVLPGGHTRKGYGAEITITATSYLTPELLPTTFRNLVVKDVVDLLAPIVTYVVNDPAFLAYMKSNEKLNPMTIVNDLAAAAEYWDLAPSAVQGDGLGAAAKATAGLSRVTTTVPAGKSRRARLPIPPSQIKDVIGKEQLMLLVMQVYLGLKKTSTTDQPVHLMDVRGMLTEETQAAYEMLCTPEHLAIWDTYCNPRTSNAIRERRVNTMKELRCSYKTLLGVDAPYQPSNDPNCRDCTCDTPSAAFCLHPLATSALGWTILVESSLLNDHLVQDMREAMVSKGCASCGNPQDTRFYGPDPSPEARAAFMEYVRCRWPIHVFALDPVTDEQNVQDEFSRRREMQMAIALAFASGNIGAQGMMRYTRRLEWDMATIALNQTQVGFSHGDDTFGWRFYPRFQTPPIQGGLVTFGQTLFGGPTTDADMCQRQLEPGMRECTAIILMPSFVPYVTFDTHSNWFPLVHPKHTAISTVEMMKLSRSIKSMQNSAAICAKCAGAYRDGEVPRLLKRVDQLDRELPLQTTQVQVPFENDLGGFEMFNSGITDLAPELISWYGAPGVDINGTATMFLVGDKFSIHDTQVIAGGRSVPNRLMSRQVLRVEIPPGVQTVADNVYGEAVEVHLATPYGITGQLIVPVTRYSPPGANAGQFALEQARMQFHYVVTPGATAAAVSTATVDTYFSVQPQRINIDAPASPYIPASSASVVFMIYRSGTNEYVGQFTQAGIPFDPRNSQYYIAGGDMQTFGQSIVTNLTGYINEKLKLNQAITAFDITIKAMIAPSATNPPLPLNGTITATVGQYPVPLPAVTPPAAPAAGS